MKPIEAIRNDKAKLVGRGPWIKNSSYHVYEYEGRFYAVVVADQMNCWIMDDTLEEIPKDKISYYIGD